MLSAVIRSAHGYPACPLGRRTGIPEVRPSRSSRTMEGSPQCSNACTGYGPNCLQLLLSLGLAAPASQEPSITPATARHEAWQWLWQATARRPPAKGVPPIAQGVRLYLHLANSGCERRRVMSADCCRPCRRRAIRVADIPSFRMKSLRGQAAVALSLRLFSERCMGKASNPQQPTSHGIPPRCPTLWAPPL